MPAALREAGAGESPHGTVRAQMPEWHTGQLVNSEVAEKPRGTGRDTKGSERLMETTPFLEWSLVVTLPKCDVAQLQLVSSILGCCEEQPQCLPVPVQSLVLNSPPVWV